MTTRENDIMTIDEAIKHCDDIAKDCESGKECSNQHIQLAAWLRELVELREKYKYAIADIQNIKKRFERERHDFIISANQELLIDFISIYDDIERALRFSPDNKGLIIIHKNMENLLNEEGCEKIKCKAGDEFNPKIHDALSSEESEIESGRITNVILDGWTICGKLLRAAKVIVAR